MAGENWAIKAGSVRIGDRDVHRVGLGTNRLTDSNSTRDLLRHAVELGVNFIDTADVYQSTASESTIGNTFQGHVGDLVVATKGGMVRAAGGGGVDGHPDYLRRAAEASLERLRLPFIELYQLHRVDPSVPIEPSVGALKALQDVGKIRHIGLSNVTVAELERARRVATIVSVQNQYNLLQREQEPVLEYCEAHSIVFIPWTPLARGNPAPTKTISEMSSRYRVTPQQLVLRWLLSRSPVILPIPGTLSLPHLQENLAAAEIPLSDADFHELSG
jgi:pyridoxine 4-dehydrogenase